MIYIAVLRWTDPVNADCGPALIAPVLVLARAAFSLGLELRVAPRICLRAVERAGEEALS